MFDVLTNSVFQIKCGEKTGTGFLINKNTCITVFHVIINYETDDILLLKNDIIITKASLNTSINDECKRLDFAILDLKNEIIVDKYLEFGSIDKITTGTNWISRGFPGTKSSSGENILEHQDNVVNQHSDEIMTAKTDIQLNHNRKWDTFEGMSGAPLIISNKVVGLINSELSTRNTSKELHALSIKKLKAILFERGISVCEDNFYVSQDNVMDLTGFDLYNDLNRTDARNLSDKLKDVCESISDKRIAYFCRELVGGKNELARYSDQAVSSVKYRIFETCQKELLDFIEANDKPQLTIEEIDKLLNCYTLKAKEIIDIRSIDYKYPFKNTDILRKIVLDLINDCFLSFDKSGIYED